MLIAFHQCTAWPWALVSTLVSALAAAAIVVTITLRFGRPRFDSRLFFKRGAEGLGFAVAMSTSSLYNDLDKTMLSHYGMNRDNGIYSMAYRIVDIATIPIFSLRDAAMPRFFKLGREGISASAGLARKLLRRTLILGAIGSAAIYLAAPLIPIVVGREFIEGVAAMRWLCLIPLFRGVHQIAGSALTGAGMQRYRTATQLLAATLNFFLNLWLIPRWGWHGAAWSSLCTDAALAAMNWGVFHFHLRQDAYA
jgi:O-antigen/teichoic acid export membrane protein